jgi:HPt (histidine-containing phosphotransfer) domain-containing protein
MIEVTPSDSDLRLVDPDAIRRLVTDVGEGSLGVLLGAFADEMRRREPVLRAAIEAGDLTALAATTHALKGSALSFGADALGIWASRANAAARVGDPEAVPSAKRTLELIDPTLAAVAVAARGYAP